MGSPLVRVRLDSAGYGESRVLGALAFDLEPGRTLSVLGPGGSGKSTLLRLLAGATDEFEGLHFEGVVEVATPPVWMPQKTADWRTLLAGQSAAGEASCGDLARSWAATPDAAHAVANALADPDSSSPELGRLAELTAVLASPAQLLLLDEPDADVSEQVRSWMAERLDRERGRRTIVLVTHHLGLARQVSDDAVLLVDGELIEAAATEDLFARPTRVRTREFVRTGS